MNKLIASLRRKRVEDGMVDLITRYMGGECSADEAAEVKRRLETDADFRAFVDPIIWATTAMQRVQAAATMTVDKQAGWQEFRARAIAHDPVRGAMLPERLSEPDADDVPFIFPPLPPPTLWERTREFISFHRPRFTRRLGVLLMILLIVELYGPLRDIMLDRPSRIPPSAQATPLGTVSTVVLANGSHATLAPGSTLKTPGTTPGFPARTVDFDGEAFFDVAANGGAPIMVRLPSRALAVAVEPTLGRTAFDIRAYLDDSIARIVVVEGSVRVARASGDTTGVILGAGEEMTVSKKIMTPPAATHDTLTWRYGMHTYQGVPLGQILRDMMHWYGITYDISMRPEVGDFSVVARFPVGAPIDSIAAILHKATGRPVFRGRNSMKVIAQ